MRGSTGVWSRRTSRSYKSTQVVLRSWSGWWFRFCCWNNLKISVMSKLSDDGLIFLTGSIYRERHTFSGNLLQLPQTWPISVKGSAKKVRNVYWSCRSISSIQRSKRKKWSLIPRSRKKHHLSHRFQTGEKSHWHLQKHCASGRDGFKTELVENYSPTPFRYRTETNQLLPLKRTVSLAPFLPR